MFPTRLQSLAEVYCCTRRLVWRKCSLNGSTALYFSEIQWFREYFETTEYLQRMWGRSSSKPYGMHRIKFFERNTSMSHRVKSSKSIILWTERKPTRSNNQMLWNDPIHGRTTYQPNLTTFLQPRHIPTQGYNITQSSAPDDGHMVARNMLSNC